MSKRSGNIKENISKKQRLENLDDFWDDDLDGDLIDECFNRATQICQEEKRDTSLLTSYTCFKQPNGMFTSTQIPAQNLETLEQKVKELQEKCAEKEGEVMILRANIQSLRASCQAEQERKDKEWKDKLNLTQKENNTVKSELEFKNLEVANLKQQIAELTKLMNNEQNMTQRSKLTESNITSPQKPIKEITNLCSRIVINSEIYYPLKCFDFSFIFKPILEDNCIITNKHNLYKTVTYLQNQSEESAVILNLRKKPVMINEKELDVDYVYAEITFLLNLSLEEINSEKSRCALNKIICLSLQLLTDFYDYLEQIEDNIQLQNVQESDSIYLEANSCINKSKKIDNFWLGKSIGMGIKCGKLLSFLAEILPFNNYLQNYLLQDNHLNLDNNECVKLFPCLNTATRKQWWFLTLILKIISTIGRTRQEQFCTDFLCCVIKLLCRSFDNKCGNSLDHLIYQITKEVLFLRPHFRVINEITTLLKVASKNSNFIHCLCSKSNQNKVNTTTKGVLHFNKDSCRFHIFVLILENSLPKLDNNKIFFDVSVNMLTFIYNIFKTNDPWLYQLEDKRCKCLCQLYKLGIGIVYKNLKTYHTSNVKETSSYKKIFKNGIKILHLLTFSSYELTQKYVTDFAQFREIVYTLIHLRDKIGLDENDMKSLEKLNTTENLREISRDKFNGIDF